MNTKHKMRKIGAAIAAVMMMVAYPLTAFAINSQAALEGIAASGGTAVLTGDITMDVQLTIAADMTLDLNGHTLTIDIPTATAAAQSPSMAARLMRRVGAARQVSATVLWHNMFQTPI